MFSYLRYFSIISFVVVVAAAIMLGVYFRSIASNDLADVAEKSSISLAQGFINTTWKKHLPNIRRLQQVDTSQWAKYKEFVAFSEDTFRHFEGVPVTQLNIYTPQGKRVLSVNQDAEIQYVSEANINTLPEGDENAIGFATAKRGEPYSRIVEDSTFKSPSGQEMSGAVVQTFVPILPDSYSSVLAGANVKIDGVIEVFYDITPQWEQLYLFQTIGTGGILIIFVILIGALFFTSKKAEGIITTQHEANVELATAAAKAEAESRQKSQFLANVSHELRTPLNAIIGFSEIIKNEVMGALNNDTYMNYIKDIHSSGVHLLSLINDILDFSKAEAGKLELHLSEMDATKLIKNCMRLVSPRAEQAKVNLVTEVPNEHFIITGDAKKLKQVLLNLLSNAVKFTPEEGEVKVTAWQNVMDDSIAIEVKDSGIGIAPKDISRAMSPFGQVDSALSRKYEGTGLGLPLTKKFVEIMGGTFKIESEVNVGTTITITIPLTPPRHVMKAAARAHEESAPEEPREKQISPALMAHANPPAEQAPAPADAPAPAAPQAPQQMMTPPPAAAPMQQAPAAPTPATTPAPEPAAATPPPAEPTGYGLDVDFSSMGGEKPQLMSADARQMLQGNTQTPPASTPPNAEETPPAPPQPIEAPQHLQPAPPPQPSPLQPVRSLTAGKSLPQQPAAPTPAPTPAAPPPSMDAPQQPPQEQAPPQEMATPQPAPAAPQTPMPEAPQAPSHDSAPAAPVQDAPASEEQAANKDAERTSGNTPPASSGGHKFTSYADMKKMMQQKQQAAGSKPEDGNNS